MRALPALLVSVALLGAACSDDRPESRPSDSVAGSATTAPPTTADVEDVDVDGDGGGGGRLIQALAPFADCTAFLEHVKAEARQRVGPYGLGTSPIMFASDMAVEMTSEALEVAAADDAAAEAAPSAPASADGAADVEFTGTNVQEAGVDEADIVKTDGQRILSISDGVLTYVDLSGDAPAVAGRLHLGDGWGHEMFFAGDRAIVLTNGGVWGGPWPVEPLVVDDATEALPPVGPGTSSEGPAAIIMEIDLSDPAQMRIANTLRIQGQYLSARAIDEHVRLAVTTPPVELPWVVPQSAAGEDRATETNRQVIEESTLDDWTPTYTLTGDAGESSGPLLACDRMHRPAEFSGFDLVSVVDLDLSAGLRVDAAAPQAVGVLAGGQTVYSSLDRFYVATTTWGDADLPADQRDDWNDDFETQLHAFAIAAGEPTTYVASGAIEGSLLNQFSMDEHEGFLRVVTTTGSPWGDRERSESGLVVLQEQGDQLVTVGSVGGLGQGEQLYSARLMGDIGFAVTFRQIDPFYVLDLRDPAAPKIAGELKIPGFSTYLHQIDDRHVLGIGQDATDQGRPTGLKLSLFDVSDPANPTEVSVWTLPDASSSAEWDHRAFQISGSTAIVPVQSWSDPFNGAVVFDIADAITERGRVEHVPEDGEPDSDCRAVTADGLTPDGSELWYLAQEPTAHVQVCGPDAIGGWGTWECDPIPFEDLQYWFWDEATADSDLAVLGMSDGDRLEVCWDDGFGQHAIQRSLVIGDELWTVSPAIIQSNALDGLAVVDRLVVR